MLSFKEFVLNRKNIFEENMSHEVVGDVGERLDHTKNNILGRKSKAKIVKNYSFGEPVSFGIDPKTGSPFVSDGKNTFTDVESINKVYNGTPQQQMYTDVLTHAPKVIPSGGGTYHGRYAKFQRVKGGNYTSGNAVVEGDSSTGKQIKNSKFSLIVSGKGDKLADLSTFNKDPDVHLIDPKLNISTTSFTPEHQQAYNHHMMSAKKAYTTLKPDAFDNLGAHSSELTKFTTLHMGDKPPKIADYMKYLTDSHTKEVETKLGPKQKDRVVRRLNDLQSTVNPSFNNILSMNWHLGRAHNMLKNVIMSHRDDIVDTGSTFEVHHAGKKHQL